MLKHFLNLENLRFRFAKKIISTLFPFQVDLAFLVGFFRLLCDIKYFLPIIKQTQFTEMERTRTPAKEPLPLPSRPVIL